MSQVIDTKVVEMQFDGSKFQKNIEVCLNSLKFLNKSVDEAGKNRNALDGLAKAGDQVGISFDNMNMKSRISLNLMDMLAGVGTKAFNRISDAVAGFALNMANSLSGMQAMRDGFNEYELKMGSVQTILAGAKIKNPLWSKETRKEQKKWVTDTDKRLDIVNQKLEELNTYSDKTIYSFKDMTSNIGKFTNAGVDLDTAVKAIQGVANVAAVSGANANEASRAMYNFAQALSSGSVKLIDWKSIENANMATVEFKQQLLNTAVALGTVEKAGNKYNTITGDAKGKTFEGFKATTKFNDSLSAQWLTTEVLTQTLKNYSTDVREMTDDQKKAYKAQLKSVGYTKDQIKEIMKLGSKAFDAATEVKTFSQMIDTLKESLGSGWAQTFEIVFGDFEEAKKLWTNLNNVIDGLLSPIGQVRNEILKLWKILGGRDAILQGFSNLYKAITGMLEPVKELWAAFTPTKGHAAKYLIDISKYFERFTAWLLEKTPKIAEVLHTILRPVVALGNYISKKMPKILSVLKTIFKILFTIAGAVVKVIVKVIMTTANIIDKIISKVKAFRDTIVNTFKEVKKRVLANKTVQGLIKAFNELKVTVSDLFGRVVRHANIYADKFAGYLQRLWKAISPLVSSAFSKIITTLAGFILPKLRKAIQFVIDKLKSLKTWLEKIDIKKTKLYQGLSKLPEKLQELTTTKAFTTLKKYAGQIKDFGRDAVQFLSDKFKNLKFDMESIKMPSGLSDAFEKIKDFIRSIFGKESVKDDISEALDNVADSAKNVGTEKDLTPFQKFLEGLKDAFDWITTAADKALGAIKNFAQFIINNTPKLVKSLHDFLAGDDGILTLDDVTGVIYTVSDALSMLLTSSGLQSFGSGISTMGEAFGEFTTSINGFLKQAANAQKMTAIKDFAISLGVLVGALYLLSKIPTDKLIGAVSALGIVGLGLIKFFDQISSTNYTKEQIFGNLSISALLIAIGVAMIGVATSIGMLVGALALFPKVIKQYNDLGDDFRDGMDRVGEVLAQIFEYIRTSLNGKYALRSALAIYVLVKALNKLRSAILDFAKIDDDGTWNAGLNKIRTILNMLGKFLQSVVILNMGFNIGANFNSLGIALIILAVGHLLEKIVPVIQEAGKIPIKEVANGMNVIEKILWRIGIFITALNANSIMKAGGGGTSLKEWIGISLTIGLISSAIGSIVGNIDTLTKLASGPNSDGYQEAIETIQGIFIGLSVLMGIIGTFKPGGAGVLFSLSVSIGILTLCVMALVPLANAPNHALLEAVGSIGALMIALGIALALAGRAGDEKVGGKIVMLIGMVGAMWILAGALRRLVHTAGDPGSLIAAGAAMGIAAVAIAGAMWILSKMKTIPTPVLIGLGLLTAALWALAFAIKWFKGSGEAVANESTEINKGIENMGDGANEAVGSMLKKIDVSSILAKIGKIIGEKIQGFDLGKFIREKIEQVKADALNWAQDFIDVGTNIVEGVATAIGNPDNIARIKDVIKALGQGLLDAFKSFFGINSPSTVMAEQGGFILDGLVQGLMDFPGKLADWVTGIGTFIKDGVSGFFTGAVDAGKTLVEKIGTGIQNGKDFVAKKASEVESSALKKIGKFNEWGKKATKAAHTFGTKLQNSKNPVKKAAGAMVNGATTVVSGLSKIYGTSAMAAITKFHSEIRAGSSPAKAAAKAVIASAKAAFNGIKDSFTSFGQNAAQGFRNGINSLISSVAEKAREMVRRAKNAAKAEQDSNSPSRDFMEYGGWAAEGYAIGMTNRQHSSLVEQSARKMVATAKNAVSGARFGGSLYLDSNSAVGSLAYAMAQISDTLDDNLNSSPTIRPVMDMTNVNHNAAAIAALFGDKSLTADLDATGHIQSDLARTIAKQNEAMSMKSIEKLANKLSSMTDTMNSRSMTNYITVDGSEDPMMFADKLIRGLKLNARAM